jgi:hypothetical protein
MERKTRRHWSTGLRQRVVPPGSARHRAATSPHHAVLIELISISAALYVRQRTVPQAM